MKKITYVFSLMLLSSLVSECAASGYFSDRKNDLLDTPTLTLSHGLGTRARVGPFHTGLNIGGADFLLGWTSLDIYGDDICLKKDEEKIKKENSNE